MKLKFFPLLLVIACSATHDNPDPHREFNEDMLELNKTIDKNVLKPVASAYKGLTPDSARIMVSNFLDNLEEPFYFVNYTFQGSGEGMATSVFRFIINSTIGLLGFIDVAELMGAPKHKTGYKETLYKLSIPHQDYIVLPIFGPSSTRDAIAEPISWFANPVTYLVSWPISVSKKILSTIVDRAENSNMVDSVLYDSINPYAMTRTLYLQTYGIGDDVPSNEDNAEDEED